MSFSISTRSLFALGAYVFCFTASYFLFWDDQMRLTSFHIDPHQSVVTRFLVKHSVWSMKGEARLIGTILAFASIHFSWSARYFIGDRLLTLYSRRQQKTTGLLPEESLDKDSSLKITQEK